MKIGREALYAEVWAEPMTTVAKRYAVSSNYLARICERLNIPRPSRGYWQQVAVGITVERDPLPDPEPGDEIEWARDGSRAARAPMTVKASRAWKKGERPDKHPLLVGARAHFDHARESRDSQYVRPYKKNLVDVLVSKDMLDRALKVASDLFLEMEDRGRRVILAPSGAGCSHRAPELRENGTGDEGYELRSSRWSPATPTVALVNEVTFGLTVFELAEEAEVEYENGRYVRVLPAPPSKPTRRRTVAPSFQRWATKRWLPSGRLAVHAYAARRNVDWSRYWREKQPGELEAQLQTILRSLERAVPEIVELVEAEDHRAEEERRKWKAQQEEWERQRVEAAKKHEEQRRREEELQREKDFEVLITRWRLSRDVRAYLADVRSVIGDNRVRVTPDGDLDRHLKWVDTYATKIDPLHRLRVEVAEMNAKHEAAGDPQRAR